MATPLGPDVLVRVLRNAGVKVVEYKSWRTNNRNHKGPWGPVHGVMLHHTVTRGNTPEQTMASVQLCYAGHSDLPGPLCQIVVAKDGTFYMVGNGRANHAGAGDDEVLAAVKAERSPLPADNEASVDGNPHFYGFEAINLGDGKDAWPPAQLAAIERGAAAICVAHGWSERSVIGHKEWQPGKIDPTFNLDVMRSRIAHRITALNDPVPTPPKADTPMATTINAEDKVWIIEAIKNNTSLVMLRTDGQYLAPTDADDWSADPNNSHHWWSGTTVFDSLVTTGRRNEKRLLAILAHLGLEDPAA